MGTILAVQDNSQISCAIYTYGPVLSDSRLLISLKDPSKINTAYSNSIVLDSLFDFLAFILQHRNAKLFLDYPFHFHTLVITTFTCIFNFFLSSSTHLYLSVRGNLITSRSKKSHFKHIFYYFYCLPFIGKHITFICSSSFEASFLKHIKTFTSSSIIIITDIVFCHSFFSDFQSLAFKYLSSGSSEPVHPESLKLFFPARISNEKRVIEVINMLHYRVFQLRKVNTILYATCTKINLLSFVQSQGDELLLEKLLDVLPYINFLGWLDKDSLYYHINLCDVVLVPSLFESFSIVTLESLLLNTNVLITKDSPWPIIQKCCDQTLPLVCAGTEILSNAVLFNILLDELLDQSRPTLVSYQILYDAILQEANCPL